MVLVSSNIKLKYKIEECGRNWHFVVLVEVKFLSKIPSHDTKRIFKPPPVMDCIDSTVEE